MAVDRATGKSAGLGDTRQSADLGDTPQSADLGDTRQSAGLGDTPQSAGLGDSPLANAPVDRGVHHEADQRVLARWALSTLVLVLVAAAVVAVTCAMLAPGSLEYVTDIGDMPVNAQDEMRVAGEVWFAIAMGALAIVTTIVWWRRAVWRGPAGLALAAAAASVQTGVGALIWWGVVRLRGFDTPTAVGAEHLKAPVLGSTASLWLAAVCAVLTYIALAIIAPRSDLTPQDTPDDTPEDAATPPAAPTPSQPTTELPPSSTDPSSPPSSNPPWPSRRRET